mmetsp:Transcript_38281/g.70692  ORF Transcript_38281/g.70692 Transcript_38281/m.70692 type:complete len:229 (+) Transcript_38281:337-1023(+)
MSFTLVTLSAVFARAMNCSFFALASRIFSSKAFIPSYSLSRLAVCTSICAWTALAASSNCCLRVRASLARSSRPRRRASWARPYHSSLLASFPAFSFKSFLCVAVTSEYVWRILTKSLCMSSIAWFMIFSGLSRFFSTLFMLPLATRTNRSIKFMDMSPFLGTARAGDGAKALALLWDTTIMSVRCTNVVVGETMNALYSGMIRRVRKAENGRIIFYRLLEAHVSCWC